jgi:hypothetical protein
LFYGAQGITGKPKGVYQQIQIVKHDDRFLLSNSFIPHTSRTLAACYQERWVIETVFCDLKSVLHLEKCACRKLEAQFNHMLCVLEAYLYLRQAFPPPQRASRSKTVFEAIPLPQLQARPISTPPCVTSVIIQPALMEE